MNKINKLKNDVYIKIINNLIIFHKFVITYKNLTFLINN